MHGPTCIYWANLTPFSLKMHGHGKYYWSNGDVYDGMWKDDKRHGQVRAG
jgi:hypothetical protein